MMQAEILIKHCKQNKERIEEQAFKEEIINEGWEPLLCTQAISYIKNEDKIIEFYFKARMNGISKHAIRKKMRAAGWNENIVDYSMKRFCL